MKERPILFSAPMVRALLAGTKTQTRRVVKPQPTVFVGGPGVTLKDGSPTPLVPLDDSVEPCGREIVCPYGQPGDRLWVREAWGLHAHGDDTDWLKGGCTAMDLDDHVIAYRADWGPLQDSCHWRPSIHMPRAASRITLEITSVRVELLQDISFADAAAEGLHYTSERLDRWSADGSSWVATPQNAYRALWQDINGPDSWAANPWVWVVEFRRLKP
jgi:hypothetical protein